MYKVITTNQFEKNVRLCEKRGYDMSLLYDVMKLLIETGSLPITYHPHKLKGKYTGHWECHLRPDWIMVWKKNKQELILTMTATGTHADVFEQD